MQYVRIDKELTARADLISAITISQEKGKLYASIYTIDEDVEPCLLGGKEFTDSDKAEKWLDKAIANTNFIRFDAGYAFNPDCINAVHLTAWENGIDGNGKPNPLIDIYLDGGDCVHITYGLNEGDEAKAAYKLLLSLWRAS